MPADELCIGGARGGTKTETLLIAAAFRGNPVKAMRLLDLGKPVSGADAAYISHPHYRALILREQSNDLEDLLDRAEFMYGKAGATVKRGAPAMAVWPSGAKIIFGHFGEDGWKKYIGPEYQFIGIDQAEMVPTLNIYERITSSARSKYPELYPQVFLTCNPGGGEDMRGAPGQAWLMDYFRIEDYESGRYPRFSMLRQKHGKHTMFIPSKVTDNPYFRFRKPEQDPEDKSKIICVSCRKPIQLPLPKRPVEQVNECPECKKALLEDGEYLKRLRSISSDSLRRAWLDGDWNALTGRYFPNFRPNGKLTDEPENANHCYEPEVQQIGAWWEKWVAVDFGYIHPTAILWFAKSPWGQTYVYREVVLNRTSPFELGLLIARECEKDISTIERQHMTLYLSPDAFAKRESENTVAHQMQMGLSAIMGPNSIFIADLTDHEKQMSSENAMRSMMERAVSQSERRMTIVRANNERVSGWMHIHDMMRWKPAHPVSEPDMEFAERLYQGRGLVAQQEYLNTFSPSVEVLPRLQISKDCKHTIRGLLDAMHKPGTDDVQKVDASETRRGDDEIDALRYGLFSAETKAEVIAPLQIRVDKRVEDLAASMPGMSDHSRIMALQRARHLETVGRTKRSKPNFMGHNPLAVKRAMLQAKRIH